MCLRVDERQGQPPIPNKKIKGFEVIDKPTFALQQSFGGFKNPTYLFQRGQSFSQGHPSLGGKAQAFFQSRDPSPFTTGKLVLIRSIGGSASQQLLGGGLPEAGPLGDRN